MKLLDIAHAYMELEKLAEKELPLKISYGVDKTMKALGRPFFFYANKEADLLQKYKPAEQNGPNVRFETPEITAKYNEEHKELDEIEEDIQIRPIRIDISTELDISRKSLATLTDLGIVEIVNAEEEKEESEGAEHGEHGAGGCSCGRH